MSTQVRAFHPVQGPAALMLQLFLADPTWLPEGERHDDGRWAMRVHGVGVSRQVAVRVGAPWSIGRTAWRSLSWDPADRGDGAAEGGTGRVAERLLPSFDGELGIDLPEGAVSLILDGRYQPPGGRLGAALDDMALHRVGRATAERLLADVAAGLQARASTVHSLSRAGHDRTPDGGHGGDQQGQGHQ